MALQLALKENNLYMTDKITLMQMNASHTKIFII